MQKKKIFVEDSDSLKESEKIEKSKLSDERKEINH